MTKRFSLAIRVKAAWSHVRAGVASLFQEVSEADGLEPLTPVLLESKDSGRYESELAAAMANPLIRNIAITGGYGAGKSSLIRTFKEHYRGFTYASVSLATFRKEGVVASSADDGRSGRGEDDEKVYLDVGVLIERVEQAIVQQLLYAVPADKVPRTRLKRIVQSSRRKAIAATLALVLGALAAIRLYLPLSTPPKALQPDWLVDTLLQIPATTALLIALVVVIIALYKLIRTLSLFNVDGWSVKGGKIEAVHHASVLHKHVDEIIYCFQNSLIDVVLIEDLDRFGIQDVFFRLREINAIINESPQVGRSVRFVYALNDELFAGGEKTKFFDVIIPIVPVINKENSHAKMIELLARHTFNGKSYNEWLDPELVETVCYRIDDMRLVKNIVNEFDVFARILMASLRLDWNKLFAMMVMKNLHSDHYWALSKRSGVVYQLMAGYAEWRNERVSIVHAQLDNLEALLERKARDVARDKIELRAIVWYKLQDNANSSLISHIVDRGTRYDFASFCSDDVFELLKSASRDLFYIVPNGGQVGPGFRLAAILEEMGYAERVAAISADDVVIRSEIEKKI